MATDAKYTPVSHQPVLKPMALAALWRHRAAKELRRWQQWLNDEQLINDAALSHLSQAQDQLTKLRYTIAVVAEVSRGKSELINAMLFAQHGKRIVPSGAGRTTMCPTEFFCDEDQAPFIELLSIDTRTLATPLSDLSDLSSAWQRFDLSHADSDTLALALQKVCALKPVSLERAVELGFDESQAYAPSAAGAAGAVEVPAWRYARVNVHHPLLATGLSILDTPGLNALGYEPELTYAVLPSVDAVLFLLAAELGVSRSDQLAWFQHLSHLSAHSKMAVLNKIDALNDGLNSPLDIQKTILQQIDRCAAALELPKSQLLAVSARSALAARMSHNDALLTSSRLPALESSLSTQLLEKRQAQLKAHAIDALEQSFRACSRELKGHILQIKTQLSELSGLAASNNPQQMLSNYAADTHRRYALESSLMQNVAQIMGTHAGQLFEGLSATSLQNCFDTAITTCQTGNASSIKQQLQAAIMRVHEYLARVLAESAKPMSSATHALAKVNKLNGIVDGMGSMLAPQLAEPLNFSVELDELTRLAAACGAQLPGSPLLTAAARSKAEQVVMAIRLRCMQLGSQASSATEQWLARINEPITHAFNLHQKILIKRTDTLERMQQAQQALLSNLSNLNEECAAREQQLVRMKQRCEQANWAIAGDANGL